MSINQSKIKVGIVGSSGYTGGELIRLLINHPNCELIFANSKIYEGKYISEIHKDLEGEIEMKFSKKINNDIDVLFLCLGHGNSINFLEKNKLKEEIKIIDLSQDFRLETSFSNSKNSRNFTYGLPELQKEKIINSKNIANPGCFATAIQLGLLPLIEKDLIEGEIHTSAITGSTGAGVKPSPTTHFSWRNNNISWYKPFTHQHLNEINYSFNNLSNKKNKINFVPLRGDFTRGIFCTSYFKNSSKLSDLEILFKEYYKNDPFTFVSENEIHLKQVINTNKCLIHLHQNDDLIMVTSIIDNLIKGASGQAIQNMNLMFNINEEAGLKLKSSIF